MISIKTWLDIERIFKENTFNYTELPENIARIDCFYEAIEIAVVSESSKDSVKILLKEWFQKWFDEENNFFYSEINLATIPVEFYIEDKTPVNELFARPFFREIEYLKESEKDERITQELFPKTNFENTNIIAFHSFKGGVSRTTHLAGYLFELIQQTKTSKGKVLVIDADLEAPGLTYWHDKEGLLSNVSLVDYLEAYNYPPAELEETVKFFAEELKKSPHQLGFYFLPAFSNEEQLLSMRILPQHIAKNINNRWEYSEAIYQLARALGAEFVLIDLRAGLTELSSPILFDPRIERYLVTTISEQSIRGTQLILKKLAHFSPTLEQIESEQYDDPKVIISMVKTDFKDKKTTVLDDAYQGLLESYCLDKDFEDRQTRLQIEYTDYHDELASISSWQDAKEKLNKARSISDWANNAIKRILPSANTSPNNGGLSQVEKLKDICQQYEFAEQGKSNDLLITQSLRHLAESHTEKLPQVVCVGAKGAGKTFNYIQLSRFKKWHEFLKKINPDFSQKEDIYIFPVLQSNYVAAEASNIINEARKASGISFDLGDTKEQIFKFISKNINDEFEWRKFWINLIYSLFSGNNFSINKLKEDLKFSAINIILKEKNLRVILLFDGLEEVFNNISKSDVQKKAVQTLIQLPNEINSELIDANFGMIIFLRRDFLRYAITQNTDQFEKLYEIYKLSWDMTSFLQLVYWICAQIEIIGASKDININELDSEYIKKELKKLWGGKLGGERQPYTITWVYAVLTDFKARIQARDVIRLLRYSAEETLKACNNPYKNPKTQRTLQETWSDRLLFPEAIRQSLVPCSKDKIKEIKEEYPSLKDWADKIDKLPSEKRKIPFTLEQIESDKDTIKMLIEIGAVYEDRDKEGVESYYIPEIFRAGLGFTYANRAKPRILTLMRKITGE